MRQKNSQNHSPVFPFTRPRFSDLPSIDWKVLAKELQTIDDAEFTGVDPVQLAAYRRQVKQFATLPTGILAWLPSFTVAVIALFYTPMATGFPLFVLFVLAGLLASLLVNEILQKRMLKRGEQLGLF